MAATTGSREWDTARRETSLTRVTGGMGRCDEALYGVYTLISDKMGLGACTVQYMDRMINVIPIRPSSGTASYRERTG